ncbi:thermonuclease family protein [Thalassobellus suaedae]|uniref:Thermonuclease family protein n=1 Tax=Thalassobellus suaedae TaxID=3074124 RepID=A0ABY9XVE3_9FLAO|nr:thermonuclease family protein [Flavobacteriaceae bacterium HL-DH14]
MKISIFTVFLFLSLISTAQSSKSTILINGKVTAITDGDTFKLLTQDSILHRVRIANIDCSERKQPFSKRAKQFTSNAVFGKMIKVEVLNKDRYGRLIGLVFYNDSLTLNHELVKHGLAWHYVKYSKDTILQSLEDKARKDKIGLWQDPNSIPPWEWRANKKKK